MKHLSKTYGLILLIISILLLVPGCAGSKKIGKDIAVTDNTFTYRSKFHEANRLKMIGNFDRAINLFKECIELKPELPASYFALSEIHRTQKQTETAIKFAQKAYDLNDKNKWYALQLAELYFQIGDYQNSSKFYERVVVDFEDKNLDNKTKLMEAYMFSGQKQKAVDMLNRIEVENGKSVRASVTKHDLLMELGEPKKAKAEIESLFTAYENTVQIPIDVMHYFLQTRQMEMAEFAIAAIRRIDSENGNAKIGQAELELAKNNVDQSFALLEQGFKSSDIEFNKKLMLLESLASLGFEPRYPHSKAVNKNMNGLLRIIYNDGEDNEKYLALYGRYLFYNNQIDSARLMFKRAVGLSASDFEIWMNLLDADYISEQYDSLVSDATKALELYPAQPLIYMLSGIGHYETGKLEKAVEMLFLGKDLVVNDLPLQREFEYHMAKISWKQDDKEKAIETFETLFADDPGNDKFVYGLASLYYESKEMDKAISYVKKAIELDGQNPEYLFLYGSILFEQKDYDNALQHITKAVAYDITNPQYLESLGDTNFLLGDTEKAVEFWKEAIKINFTESLKNKIDNRSYGK